MPFEDWPSLRRLLIWNTDHPNSLQPALEILHQALPNTAFTVLPSPSGETDSPLRPLNWPQIETYPDQQHQAIHWMRQNPFDAALIFTAPAYSPYPLAYLCYLAGIPIRIGQSQEFGGKVLSHCYEPPDPLEGVNLHVHLLRAAGLT